MTAMHQVDDPQLIGTAPMGALVNVGRLGANDRMWFGDDSIQVVVDGLGRPHPFDDSERVLSRWVGMVGTASNPDCEVMGTWLEGDSIGQGVVAVGTTYLLLTDTYLRCSMARKGDRIRVQGEMRQLTATGVYAFVFPLDEVEQFIGGKRGVSISTPIDGIILADIAPASADWEYSVWKNKAADFGTALMRAVLDAKAAHSDAKVRESAARVASTNFESALAGRRPAEYSFEV